MLHFRDCPAWFWSAHPLELRPSTTVTRIDSCLPPLSAQVSGFAGFFFARGIHGREITVRLLRSAGQSSSGVVWCRGFKPISWLVRPVALGFVFSAFRPS